jgi:hypothetical protein
MQARELTPAEVQEGNRNINDRDLGATELQALVRKMDESKSKFNRLKRSGKKADYEMAVRKENEFIYFNYPSLFQMHIEDKLDATFFEMLTLKRRIERGEITTQQASAIVGQQLFNRFVPHAIGQGPTPTPRMSYTDFYKQTNSTSTPSTQGTNPT